MSSNASTVGYVVGQPLEEEPPGGEQVLPVRGSALLEARAGARAAARRSALVGVGQVLLERRAAASPRADSASSSSAIRQRIRTMSASAQYATPSP